MRNEEQTFCTDHGLLVSSIWPYRIVCCFDALATPVPTACGVKRSNYSRFHPFFQQQKKVGERGTTAPAVQKCRSHAPRGALHSAKCFCNRTISAGLRRKLQEGGGLRDSLARCARWLYRRGFGDGLFAMASLNDCVTSRGSLAGHIITHPSHPPSAMLFQLLDESLRGQGCSIRLP